MFCVKEGHTIADIPGIKKITFQMQAVLLQGKIGTIYAGVKARPTPLAE